MRKIYTTATGEFKVKNETVMDDDSNGKVSDELMHTMKPDSSD